MYEKITFLVPSPKEKNGAAPSLTRAAKCRNYPSDVDDSKNRGGARRNTPSSKRL